MEITVSSRHQSILPSTKEYIENKVKSVYDGMPVKVTSAKVIIDFQKGRHTVEVVMNLKEHSFEADAETHDFQVSLDTVLAKIEKQLRKHLDKKQDHHKRPATRDIAAESEPAAETE
jgi:putative sigma-54 modulation protein